jgi:hypothetical protein
VRWRFIARRVAALAIPRRAYFRAKPIKKSATVLTITARYSSYICVALLLVNAIKITATHISKMVAKMDAYFIWLLYHKTYAESKNNLEHFSVIRYNHVSCSGD